MTMDQSKPKRITRKLSVSEQERLVKYREQISSELPDMIARDQMRKEAGEEKTLSGELRRAIHGSELSLAEIAEQVSLSLVALDEFLTGERTLRSDVMDRLAKTLGYEFTQTH